MTIEYKGSKVGFPIRRSSDQSSFAAPQGLSQRTTSFIASQRQGIHQMLLRHLIVLMIDARVAKRQHPIKKDQLRRSRAKAFACQIHPVHQPAGRCLGQGLRPSNRMNSLFTMSNIRAGRKTRAKLQNLQTTPRPNPRLASPGSQAVVEPDGIEPTTS
jgi:hypothetical protein